jgi:nicotinate-nucleotide adenylyltransferase
VGATAATWGLLGGTFDPIHYAHLAIAEHVREELDLEGVVFLPAGSPAHKQEREITPAAHRVRMVELAIADNPCFTLSTLEVERSGPTYLVDTLERLSVEPALAVPGASGFVFILSAEALLALRDWRQPERILELCRLAVVPRLGLRMAGRAWVAEHFPGREDRVIFLDGPLLGHSATTIRARAGAGRSIRYLVPPGVERYIVREQLYGGTPPSDR